MKNNNSLGILAIIMMLALSIACRRSLPVPPTPTIAQLVIVEPSATPTIEVTPTPYSLYAPAISSGSTPQVEQETSTPPVIEQPLQYNYYFPLIQSNSIPAEPE